MRRAEQTYDQFPAFLKWNIEDIISPAISGKVLFPRLLLRLAYLEIRLTMERLAHKRGILDGQSLVDCAQEMLDLTVFIWVQRDRFVEHHHDYDWILMCWGVPVSPLFPSALAPLVASEMSQEISDIEATNAATLTPSSHNSTNSEILCAVKWCSLC